VTTLRPLKNLRRFELVPTKTQAGDASRAKSLGGVPVSRPTGQELFDSLSKAEQDEMLGPASAEMVRNGDAVLSDFVEVDGGFITQKPVTALEGKAAAREYVRDDQGRFAETAGSGDKPKVPKWERQRRYNGWVRSLSAAEKEALARQFYGRLWSELAGYFGAIGQPPPLLVFKKDIPNPAQVFADEKGIRQVQLRPTEILKLAMRSPSREDYSASTIAHEWRHIFQNAVLFSIARDRPHEDQPVEQDASAFGNEVRRIMRINRRRKKKRQPLIRPYVYNSADISENVGKDPTTIPFP
jgi:hypothetical protein